MEKISKHIQFKRFTFLIAPLIMCGCYIHNEVYVTTINYNGVFIDILKQERISRFSYSLNQDYILVKCDSNNKLILRDFFFPGPDWDTLKNPNKVIVKTEGIYIKGINKNIFLNRKKFTICR